jgi:hypothetical protein
MSVALKNDLIAVGVLSSDWERELGGTQPAVLGVPAMTVSSGVFPKCPVSDSRYR